MPIQVQCQNCGGKFQAADKLAGRRVKCPRCATPIEVSGAVTAEVIAEKPVKAVAADPSAPPSSSADSWYVLTTDEERLGPIGESQLKTLVSQGRLDAFCRVRHQDSDQWQWLEEVFPNLTAGNTDSGDAPDQSRLQPCPDCGQMVSRRANQCPHCGCPITVTSRSTASPRPSGAAQAGVVAGDRLARRRKKLLLIGVGSGAFVVIAAVLVGFWVWRTIEEVPDRLFREVIVDETPPAPSDTATDQGTYAEWTTEAAMAMAKHVDEMYRKVHEANAVLDQTKASVELLKSLAEPDPFRQRSDKKEPDLDSIAEPEPYESQYDQFYEECMADVRKQVPSDGATRDAVWKAAQAWADTKQGPVEQQLDTQLKEQLGL